jgi:hypothetical protein
MNILLTCHRYRPDNWWEANVTPIFKKGNKQRRKTTGLYR